MDVYSELVESLEKCIATCNNCASSCLNEKDIDRLTECIKLDLDCADVCYITLKLLARDSNHCLSAVELCRNICSECADECDKHDYDHCQQCAEVCRRCEKNCKNYIEQSEESVITT